LAKRYARYLERSRDLEAAHAMLEHNSDDPEIQVMAKEEVQSASLEMSELEVELQRMLLPKDPDDARPAFLEIRAGTGGDESALFAGDLLRMYTKFCERKGWRAEIMSESASELGGYKEVVIRIEGDNVFGTMRFESGGHRVQRVPSTETQGRIHTSACTVAVLAEPDEAQAVTINPADLRIDTYRASGAGGQHINKTDSAVRITHIPTGTVVSCQNEKSQIQNKAAAMRVLQSRLLEIRRREEDAKKKQIAGDVKASWGEQMRSYVMAPYQMVKDLRTDYEVNNPSAVFDGDISGFIAAGIRWRKQTQQGA